MTKLILKRIAAFSYLIGSCFIVGLAMMLPFSKELFFSWIPFVLYPLTILIVSTGDILTNWAISCLYEEPKTK